MSEVHNLLLVHLLVALLIARTIAAPAAAARGAGQESSVVRPGFDATSPHWNDTQDNRIEAHAAGLLQAEDGLWYWYGESKKTSSLADHGVNAYRSKVCAHLLILSSCPVLFA